MHSLKQEAARCLTCKVPQCAKHCPVNTPIPQVVQLFREGKVKEAGELLFNNNPLSAVTSIICPHEKNCTGHCVLGIKGEPYEFFKLEEYISRLYLETYELPVIKKNGIKIAVVGSGPAGIAMSIRLALAGYSITLFDAQDDIGGVLRYGIPDFRLPKDILTMYKKMMYELGVKFRPNTKLGRHMTFDDMFIDGYKAVFVAAGTGKPNRLGLVGETLGHVHFAVDYLRTPYSYNLGKEVVVVGAGNVAMDAARSAIRKGHANVKILNFMSREDITANLDELEMAELDGAQLINNTQIVRIIDDGVRCVLVDRIVDEDGKVRFEENYEKSFDIYADSVILAIGQGPGDAMKYGKITLTGRGLFEINEFGETSTPGVFAAGDIVTGPRTVVEAVAFTQKVAQRMIEYLGAIAE